MGWREVMRGKEWRAELPLPPSVNGLYHPGINRRTGKLNFYADKAAKAWKDEAEPLLSRAGFRQLGTSTCLAMYVVFRSSMQRDADCGTKILMDTIAESLGVNDRNVMTLTVKKVITPKARHGCTVRVRVIG